jgi:pimeloyl-ACP methyl ester carboxylesterase
MERAERQAGSCSRAARIELSLEWIPNAQAEFFGGHMMFWEYPEKFNAVLDTFLKRLP